MCNKSESHQIFAKFKMADHRLATMKQLMDNKGILLIEDLTKYITDIQSHIVLDIPSFKYPYKQMIP